MIIEPAVIESVYLVWPFVRERARKACERVGVSKFEDLERNTLDGTYMRLVDTRRARSLRICYDSEM